MLEENFDIKFLYPSIMDDLLNFLRSIDYSIVFSPYPKLVLKSLSSIKATNIQKIIQKRKKSKVWYDFLNSLMKKL